MEFKRGSEWRRWELHIHTPQTKKNDQYEGQTSEEKWEKFYSDINEYIGDGKNPTRNISAIAITDYLSLDNYFKVKQDKKLNENIKLLLPNVEMRITPVSTSSPINIHCIFSPDIDDELESRFMNKLTFEYNGINYTAYKNGLISLGRNISMEKNLNKEDAYIKGIEQFVISFENFKKVFKNDPELRDNTIIVISNNSRDGASGIEKLSDWILDENNRNSQLYATRLSLYQFVDAIFSSSKSDREYFAGLKIDSPERVKAKCGSLKPCFHGSDAHSNDKIFKPDNDRFCWIKADLTFKGLKQTLNEPLERVYIGPEPSLISRVNNNKTKYIKQLIINSDDSQHYKWFNDIKIDFNSELVSIIGNKGSGKSAIVDIIALNCNAEHQANFSFLNNNKFLKKGFAENYNTQIIFEDNQISKLKKLNYKIEESDVSLVKYLPQNYFESVCNEIGKVEQLRKEIETVVFQYIPDKDKLGKYTFDELIQLKKFKSDKEIKKEQEIISDLNDKIIELEEKTDPEYLKKIKNELKIKKAELESHMKSKPIEYKMPNDENVLKKSEEKKMLDLIRKKENIEKEIQQKQENINNLAQRIEKLKGIISEVNIIIEDIEKFYSSYSEELNYNDDIEIKKVLTYEADISLLSIKIEQYEKKIEEDSKTLTYENEWNESEKENSLLFKLEKLDSEIEESKNKLSEQAIRYQTYIEESKRWEQKKLEIEGNKHIPNTIEYLRCRIDYIENGLIEDIEEYRRERLNHSLKIYEKKEEIKCIYDEIKLGISETIESYNGQDLCIESLFSLENNFEIKFMKFINKSVKGSFKGEQDGKKFLKEKLLDNLMLEDKQSLMNFLNQIIIYLENDYKNNEKRYIGNQISSIKEFYDYLFMLEYITPYYELTQGGKNLNELSPGEKGALLLVFYLILDKDDCPLIIDQPEDNLDNNSVVKVLVPFIKQAKKRRQIIMVTHNPNLAVVSDAEQIIYVNLDKKNDNKFTFISGGIENPEINNCIVDILEGTMPAFKTRENKYF